MTRDMRLYIEDILDSISKIEQYTKDINENEFLTDTQIQESVSRETLEKNCWPKRYTDSRIFWRGSAQGMDGS